jgi:putative transposase
VQVFDPKTGKPYFTKRRRRHEEDGHARELTFSCYRGYQFLSRDRTRKWFIDALETARTKWSFDLWAYVLMPEHVHLLVLPRQADLEVGRMVGQIKEVVARKAIGYLREHAPGWLPRITVREGKRVRHRFWQPGGGYDRNAVELYSVYQMIEYIHANPVRRGLVADAEDWPWSSARWYAGIRPVPIEMDPTLPPLHPDHQ